MKSILFLCLGILAAVNTAKAEQPEVDELTHIAIKANACAELVKFAQEEGLASYTLETCFRTAEQVRFEENYNPDPNATPSYTLVYIDEQVLELRDMEQWISCEFEINGKLGEAAPEVVWCSVEG